MNVLYKFLLLLAVSGSVICQKKNPRIQSISPTQNKAGGETAVLECIVQDLQNHILVWMRKEDKEVLSAGKFISTPDERFRLRTSQNQANSIYNLEIRDLTVTDTATYECHIDVPGQPRIKSETQLIVGKSPYAAALLSSPGAAPAAAAVPGLAQAAPASPTPAPRTFTARCTTGSDCEGKLVCKNNKCGCAMDIEAYVPAKKACVSKVGGPCSTQDQCVANAGCEKPSNGAGHCACKSPFVLNAAGFCEVPFGGNCTEQAHCDSVAGLDCINNICTCGKHAEFDVATRQCKGKAGAYCLQTGKDQAGNECVKHALCTESHPLLPGKCSCESGYEETSNYICKKKSLFG